MVSARAEKVFLTGQADLITVVILIAETIVVVAGFPNSL